MTDFFRHFPKDSIEYARRILYFFGRFKYGVFNIKDKINKNLSRYYKMKEYKLVYLNKGIKMSREKDLEQAQEIINEYVAEGWELQQIVSPTIW